MSTTTSDNREDVPGGRCYWCASQEHDGDHCVEAARIFNEHAERWRRADDDNRAPLDDAARGVRGGRS